MHVDHLHREIFHAKCWEFRPLCDNIYMTSAQPSSTSFMPSQEWLLLSSCSTPAETTVNVLNFCKSKWPLKWHMQTVQTQIRLQSDQGLHSAFLLSILRNSFIKSEILAKMVRNKVFKILGHLPYWRISPTITGSSKESSPNT